MKRIQSVTAVIIALILVGCDTRVAPDMTAALATTFVYHDVEVTPTYISFSEVTIAFSNTSEVQWPTVSDGSQTRQAYWPYRAEMELLKLECPEEEWGAHVYCGYPILLEGDYRNGADISVETEIWNESVRSEYSLEALMQLTSPLAGETYQIATDTVVVSWPEVNGATAYHIRLSPCSVPENREVLIEGDLSVTSYELVLSELVSTCGFSDYVSISVAYMTAGEVDDQLAGGRFRLRVFSEPVTIALNP